MIGSVHTSSAAATTSTGAAASWENDLDATHGSATHIAEPNVTNAPYGTAPNVTTFQFPRVGVAGLRGVVAQLARTGIPLLPLGPTKVARMGQGNLRVGNIAPKPVSRVQQLTPVTTPEQTGAWYEYLN